MLIVSFVVIQTIIFGIVILVLRRMLYKDTMSAVNRLKVVDEENAKRLEEMKQRIRDTEEEFKNKKIQLAEEIRKEREEAKAEMEKEKERLLAHARTEGEGIVGGAQRKAERIDREIGREMEEKAGIISAKILKRILSENIQMALHSQLVDELIQEIDALEAGQIPSHTKKVEIVSKHPLTPEQKKRIQDLLEKKLGGKIEMAESIKEELIGGFAIHMGSLVVDGSMDNRLKSALNELKKERK